MSTNGSTSEQSDRKVGWSNVPGWNAGDPLPLIALDRILCFVAEPALPIREILRVAHSHGARTVRVFGSRARGDARADSDLDLLIGLEPGRSLLDVVAIKQDLEDLLGYSVDVVTEGALSPYLRDRILTEALPLTA